MRPSSQPSRTKARRKIAKAVLVRLTKDEAARMDEQAACLGSVRHPVSSASILLRCWHRASEQAAAGGLDHLIGTRDLPVATLPAVADADMVARLRQVGGLLAQAVVRGVGDPEQVRDLLVQLGQIQAEYRGLLRQVADKRRASLGLAGGEP